MVSEVGSEIMIYEFIDFDVNDQLNKSVLFHIFSILFGPKHLIKMELNIQINEWNTNRLDLFHISKPKECLRFYGVMPFFYQGNDLKYLTKCIRVFNTYQVHSILDWSYSSKYKHECSAVKIFSKESGTSIVFIDTKSHAFLYPLLDEHLLEIEDFSNETSKVFWNHKPNDSSMIMLYTNYKLYTYTLNLIYINANKGPAN